MVVLDAFDVTHKDTLFIVDKLVNLRQLVLAVDTAQKNGSYISAQNQAPSKNADFHESTYGAVKKFQSVPMLPVSEIMNPKMQNHELYFGCYELCWP